MANMSKKLLPIAIVAATAIQAPVAVAELNVDLRSFYMNRDFREGTADKRIALTQAVRVDYTNELTDRISVGASLFANVKLDGQGDAAATGLLDEDGESYAKLGQIFADVKLAENADLRLGRWVVNTPLLNDSDSRGTPSSTQAIKVSGSVADFDLYALYTDRASTKTDESFKKYEDANGDDYGIAVFGGSTKLGNVALTAAYGDASDYARQAYFNAAYSADNLLVDFHHYDGKGEGTNSAFDATLTNLAAQYSFGDLALTASYQTVGGDSAYDHTWGGSDDNGLVTWNAVQIMDFNRQDEDSYQLRADYAFASVPGLKAMARHTTGEYTNGAAKVDESETNAELKYTLQSGDLKGLSLRMRLSHVNADAYADINEVRLIANYSF